jgi:hypothetical protein
LLSIETVKSKSSNLKASEPQKGNKFLLKFLSSECMQSTFKNDFVLVNDLEQKYNDFWRHNKVSDIEKWKIVGSPEVKDFGGVFKDEYEIPFVKGIAKCIVPAKNRRMYLVVGMARKPKKSEIKTKSSRRWSLNNSYWNSKLSKPSNNLAIRNFFFSEGGIFPNLVSVLIYIAIVISIPLLIFLAIIWSLLQINLINTDIYATNFNIRDVFNPSKDEFWLDSLPQTWIFYTILGLSILFILVGLIELIFFFATEQRDTGKYITKYTTPRLIISNIFWVLIFLYLGIYASYLSVICIWSVLGAVLNPERFLPIATGAIVVIGVAIYVFVKIRNIDKLFYEVVNTAVNDQLIVTLMDAVENKAKSIGINIDSITSLPEVFFNQALNKFMSVNDLPSVEREISNEILKGNITAIVGLLQNNCGIDECISLGLIGIIMDDNLMIVDSVYKLSEKLGVDPGINVTFAEIILDKFNGNKEGWKKLKSSLVLHFKKLIKYFYPNFPSQTLDDILTIILERSPEPLIRMSKTLNVPPELFEIAAAYAMNNNQSIEKAVDQLSKRLLPQQYNNLFILFQQLINCNLETNLKEIAKMLGVKREFLMQIAIAIFKEDSEYNNYSIVQTINLLTKKKKKKKNKLLSQEALRLTDSILALNLLPSHFDFDLVAIANSVWPEVSSKKLGILFEASKGNVSKIRDLLGILSQERQTNIIIEFCNILLENKVRIIHIPDRFGLDEENHLIFESICKLIIESAKFALRMKPKDIENNDHQTNSNKEVDLIEECKYRDKIEKYLRILYKAKAFDIDLLSNSRLQKKIKQAKRKMNAKSNKVFSHTEEEVEYFCDKIIESFRYHKSKVNLWL